MQIPIEKNKEYVVDIIDNGMEGEGIAKIDGFTIFIPNAIKGEKVKILIIKVLSSHAFAKIVEILHQSNHRTEIDCGTYKRCGGCNLRHIDYEETLNLKQNMVQNLINKNLKTEIDVKPTWGMGNPYFYRNKLQYPVGIDKNGEAVVGVYANRTHEIIPVKECMIQNTTANEIAKYVLKLALKYDVSIYNEKEKSGLLRHVIVKTGFITGEILVVLVINGENFPNVQDFAKDLKLNFENIKSFVLNINKENTNVILGKTNKNVFGDGYLKDYLGEYCFRISPNSFYQVNPVQAEALYNIAMETLEISKNDIVFDLYCGIGTITLFASKYAKKVYGVEIVEQAIEDAKWNAKYNNVENVEFFVGDTELVLTDLIENKKIIPEIVIVDPPRKGLDRTTIKNVLKIKPKKMAYISCNPATLVRDLKDLEDLYYIKLIQPVDMFPFTNHVECVSVLELKESIEK